MYCSSTLSSANCIMIRCICMYVVHPYPSLANNDSNTTSSTRSSNCFSVVTLGYYLVILEVITYCCDEVLWSFGGCLCFLYLEYYGSTTSSIRDELCSDLGFEKLLC